MTSGVAPAPLAILHADEHLVAVDKPAGLAVHRSALIGADRDVLIDRVRRQTGRTLYLAHRLDRATSGVTLLAAGREIAAALGAQFMSRAVSKRYLAVCRGWPPPEGEFDRPLDAPGRPVPKPARTRWRVLATGELDVALGRYARQRYALLLIEPETGRYRQIRRHFQHLSHPLIGDTSHGRGDHNRLFREHLGVHRLLLHALALTLVHPVLGTPLRLQAPPDEAFHRVAERFHWQAALAAASPADPW